MKKLLPFGFIALYLLAMIRPVGPLLEYIIFEDYITEFLCINKDKVALQCNGKCYLMQRIAEQNEEKKQNLPKISIEEYPIGFVEVAFLQTSEMDMSLQKASPLWENKYQYLFSYSSFHPPTQII